MVRTALREYLELARRGISNSGVLGYPVATILCAFIDAIGSDHRDVATFKVGVDATEVFDGCNEGRVEAGAEPGTLAKSAGWKQRRLRR